MPIPTLETARLIMRPMEAADHAALFAVLGDRENMRHYPAPLDGQQVDRWIERNLSRYRRLGYGLWTVVLKESGQVIGDCGLTLQLIRDELLPEIGYHIHPAHQRQGYASEGAIACRDYAFLHTKHEAVYAYMKHTNTASARVAQKAGLSFVDSYPDPVNELTLVYRMTRAEWGERALTRPGT